MSTHRNDYLVSSHQADMHRRAADARLAKVAMSASASTKGDEAVSSRVRTRLVALIRPVRRAANDAVTAQRKTGPAHGRP